MSRESCWKTFWGCIFILSFGIIIASIIVGSIGASSYVKEKHDESVYKSTMCFVKNYTITEYKCSRQECHSTGFSQQCTTVYDTCYLEIYIVIYNVSDGRELQSTIITTDGSGSYAVNQSYKCYYDSTEETSVRWTWPNSYKYLIMLCVGWAIVGFYILLIIGLIIWIKLRNR